jgi:adenylate kinase family enzyme
MTQVKTEGTYDWIPFRLLPMKRIVIIGWPASGKSAFSETLASLLNIPVYHLDALYWKPGHVRTENAEWVKVQNMLVSGESWVVEGNFQTTLDIRLAASDSVIFFDMHVFTCLRNAVFRMIKHYGRARIGMSEGNNERIDRHFLMRILRILWIYPALERGKTIRLLNSLSAQKNIFVFRNYGDASRFVQYLEQSSKLRGFN